jgi:hypothetical protein
MSAEMPKGSGSHWDSYAGSGRGPPRRLWWAASSDRRSSWLPSDMSREVGSLTKVLVAWMVGGANRNDCFGFRRSPRQFSGRT